MHTQLPLQFETKRLFIRYVTEDDLQPLHSMYSVPDCIQYNLTVAYTEAETEQLLKDFAFHWHNYGFGPYTIVSKQDSQVVGITGLWVDEKLSLPELFWCLLPQFRGRGFAREAAREVVNMAVCCLPGVGLISNIHPDNKASKRLARALGAHIVGTTLVRDHSIDVFYYPYLSPSQGKPEQASVTNTAT